MIYAASPPFLAKNGIAMAVEIMIHPVMNNGSPHEYTMGFGLFFLLFSILLHW